FEIVSATPTEAVFTEVRHLAGKPAGETVTVNGVYVTPASLSSRGNAPDDEWTLRFPKTGRVYLFLQSATDGTYRLPTPTAGVALVAADGNVRATFRHSLHQALIDSGSYELTQTCIFQKLHGTDCAPEVGQFINTQLSGAPAGLDNNPS